MDNEKSLRSKIENCSHPRNQEFVTGYSWPMLFAYCKICGKRYQRPWTQEDIDLVGDPRKNIGVKTY